MFIPSNMDGDTFFMYHCTDKNAVEFYTAAQDKITELEEQLEKVERHFELAEEQASFASDLIEKIEKALDKTRAKEIRADIIQAIELSGFET